MVTGTGRCGTRYASHVLRAAGVECGHEDVFTFPTVNKGRAPEWGALDADVSWLAVPHLPRLDARTVLLVRHPLDVVHSMLALGWFADGQRLLVSRAVERHRPEVLAETTRADRCLALWLHWNLAALPYAYDVVRFEDMVDDPRALLAPACVTGRPTAAALAEILADPERVNSKDDKKTPTARPTWDDFRGPLALAAIRVAGMFGYREGA